jgi:hypothetical protein
MDCSKKIIFIMSILGVYGLAGFIQSKILLNWDVSWLMHASQRLLNGGTYTNDFFEINPPMILYWYLPPVFLAKITTYPIYSVLPGYIFFLATVSLWMCYVLTRKIFSDSASLTHIFLFNLAVTFLILPIYEFGQREHLLLIFSLPYILLLIARLQQVSPNSYFSAIIGVMAGMVFALKPYFLVLPIFLELYALFCSRNIFYWVRAEVISAVSVLLIYCVLILFLHQDYLSIVIPHIRHMYYAGFSLSMKNLATVPPVFFCVSALFFYCVLRVEEHYKHICAVLTIAVISFLLIFFMQRTAWYYHLLPALAVACLLQALLFAFLISGQSRSWNSYEKFALFFLWLTMSGLFFYFVSHEIHNRFLYLMPTIFIAIYGGFYVFLLPQFRAYNVFQKIMSWIFYLAFAFMFVYFVQDSIALGQVSLRDMTIMLCLIMSFGFFVILTRTTRYQYIFLPILAAMIFTFPVCWSYDLYRRSVLFSEKMQSLIAFLQQHARQRSIFIFSTMTEHMFPTVDYANAIPATRFAFLGWLPAALKYSNPALDADIQFFNDMLMADLIKEKPEFIMIDVQKNKAHLDGATFDYLTYFAHNQQFQMLWRHYHYMATVSDFPFYQLRVYRRSGF